MTRRADYTSGEWVLLTTTVETVGLGMLAVSHAGLIGRLRELRRLSLCLTRRALPIQFTHNELVMAVLADVEDQSGARVRGPFSSLAGGDVAGLIAAVVAAHLRVLGRCERVAALLAKKSPPEEADGLKRWLMWLARYVANASGERWFGLGRTVTAEKATLLDEIAAALEVSRIVPVPTVAQLDALLGPAPRGSGGVSSGGASGNGHDREHEG